MKRDYRHYNHRRRESFAFPHLEHTLIISPHLYDHHSPPPYPYTLPLSLYSVLFNYIRAVTDWIQPSSSLTDYGGLISPGAISAAIRSKLSNTFC